MKNSAKEQYSRLIKAKAKEMGFDFVGISKADLLEEDAPHLERWLKQGMQAGMQYMDNHFDKRLDPRKLVDGAKSVISLLYNYHHTERQTDPDAPKLSSYAFGKDYHFVIKDKLKLLMAYIYEEIGEVGGRVFVDSAPVLDRAWARKSGLGWIGKNSMLINKGKGSYYFIAELILDLELEADGPIKDYCGTCTKCISACPTDAIVPDRTIDSNRCISYLTIELKEAIIPHQFEGMMENWMFGCDICQEVCPWNRFAEQHQEAAFLPKDGLLDRTKKEWEELTEEIFRELFRHSAVKRTKYKGLKRNIDFLKKSSQTPQ